MCVPELQGFSHIDLTVSGCAAAAAWWQDVMGFIVLNRSRRETFEAWTLIHSSGLVVSVVAHDDPLNRAFDERRVGLDHLCFKVEDRDELNRWVTHFDAKRVPHSGVIDIGFGPTVVFVIPTTSNSSSSCSRVSTNSPVSSVTPIHLRRSRHCASFSRRASHRLHRGLAIRSARCSTVCRGTLTNLRRIKAI